MAEGGSVPKPGTSSRLQQMGFMKRAAKRKAQEIAKDVSQSKDQAEVKQENAEEWSAQVPETTGCVVLIENDPQPGATSGRFSFNGANQQVEDQVREEEQKQKESANPDGKSVSDIEMQNHLTPPPKRPKIHDRNKGSQPKSSGKKGRYFD